MMKFFDEGEEILSPSNELKSALRKRVLAGDFYLVTGGDGRGVIVEKVLDLMKDYLPSPLNVEAIWGKNPKAGDEAAASQMKKSQWLPWHLRLPLTHL